MEFQIAEAIELIKTLAETENVTHTQALQTFVAEAGLDLEGASILKAALFEEYTLQEMASDTLTRALHTVFVTGTSNEELQEMDTKETQEGTKYKIRVKDRQSGSSYIRYATREKIAELRANPNISSVELTDHGQAGEDDRGERTAAAKGGGGGGDRDGDGKVESSSKEHAGVVHNAIQRKMGGKPDGQDTRREEFGLDEEKKEANLGKMEKQEAKHRKASTSQRGGGRGDSKNKSMKMGSIRSALERGEDPRRDTYGGKRSGKDGTHPPEDHRKAFTKSPLKDRPAKEPGVKKESAWEQYLELRATKLAERFEVTDADEKGNTEAYKRFKAGNPAYKRAESKKKVETKEEWKPDPTEKRKAKGAKLGREEEIERGKSKKYGRDEDKIKDLYRRRMAVDFKKKKSSIGEDIVTEGDLVDAGRENQGERSKKKLTGKGVDNSGTIKLMPRMESVVTEHSSSAINKLTPASLSDSLRAQIKEMRSGLKEECCPKCGTPECVCEGKKKEEKKRKPKAKLDESGMPILEYSQNNATGPTKEMIDPPADPTGEPGVKNPKGKPKRYKNKGEAPGDRRPNDPSGPELPFDKGTVPNGSGV